MVRRKERRRQAAMSNAGRRTKLDLSAEPSGDMGGSSAKDEVEGDDIDASLRAELPHSPSSSSGKPQNPLQLLGQYSDDELDEESNRRDSDTAKGNSLAEHNEQAKESFEKGCEDIDLKAGENISAQQVKEQVMDKKESASLGTLPNKESSSVQDSGVTLSGSLDKEINMAEDHSVSDAAQVIGDVSSGWKLVLHEESNQYYYWNTETGETSWEVPGVSTNFEMADSAPMDAKESIAYPAAHTLISSGGFVDAGLTSQSKGGFANVSQMDVLAEGGIDRALEHENHRRDITQDDLRSSGEVVTAPIDAHRDVPGSENKNDKLASEEQVAENDLPSGLVKQCEELLERLTILKGFTSHLHGHDWISKFILEIEIRHSDYISLLSHGSSLQPFWLHSERQMKGLESAINDRVTQFSNIYDNKQTRSQFCMINDDKQNYTLPSRELDVEGSMACKSDADKYKNELVSSACEASSVQDEQINGNVPAGGTTCKTELYVVEDVDMDVDMDVDDLTPDKIANVAVKDFVPSEQSMMLDPPPDFPSSTLEDGEWVPPPPPDDEHAPPLPPDDEHVPPPPPDDEQAPPPPPGEPPEAENPPPLTCTEAVTPFSYTEQFNILYPDPNVQYYGNSFTGVSDGSFYGHAEGSHVSVPPTQLYYGAEAHSYHVNVPVVVNPAAPVPYYDFHVGTVPLPAASSLEASMLQNDPGSVVSYSNLSEKEYRPSSSTNIGVSTSADIDTEISSVEVPSTSATIQAPAVSSAEDNVPETQTGAVFAAAAAAAAAAKVKSKVPRSKKRTVTVSSSLKSNKKVSGLVDKWKAAKEELLEDEKEPENAYEFLEKKRQREIEEWRAQQIASGEAKDNANFQPLGGDWRERVKRRRGHLSVGTTETTSEVQNDGKEQNDEKQQPDLVKLSRDLPAGWQAYWDEPTRQIYYGNAMTSKTSWIKPTK